MIQLLHIADIGREICIELRFSKPKEGGKIRLQADIGQKVETRVLVSKDNARTAATVILGLQQQSISSDQKYNNCPPRSSLMSENSSAKCEFLRSRLKPQSALRRIDLLNHADKPQPIKRKLMVLGIACGWRSKERLAALLAGSFCPGGKNKQLKAYF